MGLRQLPGWLVMVLAEIDDESLLQHAGYQTAAFDDDRPAILVDAKIVALRELMMIRHVRSLEQADEDAARGEK